MEIIVRKKFYDGKGNINALLLSRKLTIEEKLENMVRYYTSLGQKPYYIKPVTAIMAIPATYIDDHNVKLGDNINSYDDIDYTVTLVETTNRQWILDEGYTPQPKINPKSKQSLTHNGKVIYRCTFVEPIEDGQPDIKLKHD